MEIRDRRRRIGYRESFLKRNIKYTSQLLCFISSRNRPSVRICGFCQLLTTKTTNSMIRIAIDPDIDKNGFAWQTKPGEINIESLEFPKVIDKAVELSKVDANTVVIIEGGWLNKSNFHLSYYDTKAIATRKGYNVGENHRTGKLLKECLEHNGIKVLVIPPIVKRGTGKDKKMKHEEVERVLKQIGMSMPRPRSNQEERDAILLLVAYLDAKRL